MSHVQTLAKLFHQPRCPWNKGNSQQIGCLKWEKSEKCDYDLTNNLFFKGRNEPTKINSQNFNNNKSLVGKKSCTPDYFFTWNPNITELKRETPPRISQNKTMTFSSEGAITIGHLLGFHHDDLPVSTYLGSTPGMKWYKEGYKVGLQAVDADRGKNGVTPPVN